MPISTDANLAPRAQTVRRLAQEQGFALLGIAPAQPSEHTEHVVTWLARGSHGEMGYLAQNIEQRLDPRALLPGARSIICVADLYVEGPTPSAAMGKSEIPFGRIARYAWGDDYHRVMKKRLHTLADALRERWPEHHYRTTVDTAPILEREHAQRAGLGWTGKHTLLIHPDLGSWLLLGEIITTLPLQTAADAGSGPMTDHCGTCTRCIDACPTQCITPHQIDAQRCISYLTLEHRGPIDPALFPAMGSWIAGCDVCQEVCPFNQEQRGFKEDRSAAALSSKASILPNYRPRPPAPGIQLLDLLNWDGEERRRAFERSALKRLKLDQLKRNALIAAGNYLRERNQPALRHRIEEIAGNAQEVELVRATASAVLARLDDPNTRA